MGLTGSSSERTEPQSNAFQKFPMRSIAILTVMLATGCQLLPPKLPPTTPAPPAGDTVLLFGTEVPANAEAIKAAFARRVPAGTSYSDVLERLNADGFLMGYKERQNRKWVYTVTASVLMPSRWGMIQNLRIRLTEDGGPEEVWLGEIKRLPESAMLESCPNLRSLPGMPRDEAEALLRENGFKVREKTTGWSQKSTQLYARRWSEPSVHAASAMLVCRVEDGRIATLSVATAEHSSRGFDGFVGMFPDRDAPVGEQLKAYAVLPFSLAGVFGLGMLQWMALPLAI